MEKLLESKEYQELVTKNNYNTLAFLLNKAVDFAIVVYTDFIEFNPQIPTSIIEFDKQALFIIAGYSKESAHLEESIFHFEAGFGESNFGSNLSIPLDTISQIAYNEELITFSHYKPKKEPKATVNIENSMELLLNNPENQNLLKKRKK